MKRPFSLFCTALFLLPLVSIYTAPIALGPGMGSAMAESSRACPGSWTISGSVTLNGDTCTVSSNIIIQNGGNLTMRNTDITMNLASQGQYYIEVQNGGALHVLAGSNITTSSINYETYMNVLAGAKLEIRDSDLSEFGYLIPNYGIEIYTNDAVIDNTTIGGGFEGLYIENANPTITNNTIQYMSYHGIEATNSAGIIADNIVKKSGSRGIMIDSGASSLQIVNNNLTDNYEGLHVKIGTSALVKGNTIDQKNNGGRGIIVDQSSPIIVGNTIENCNVGIQYLSKSGGIARANKISHGDGNQDVGIKVLQQSNPEIDDNTIYDFWRGATVFGLSDPIFNGNTITTNTQYGIYFNGGLGIYRNNTINDTTGDGLNVFSNSDADFYDNHIFDNGNDGMHVDSSVVDLANNNISKNTITALHLIGDSTATITDNLISKNGYGVELEDSSVASMINNDFLDNIARAVNVVSGNHLDWTINDNVMARGNNINLAGNLTITSSGSLDLEDMSLIFHSTASEKWWLDAAGPLTITRSTIKAQDEQLHYSFRAHDTLTVTDGAIRDAGLSGTDVDAGVYINGTDATFTNSLITSGYSGIVANGATVTMENGQIDNNDMIGIRASGGSNIIISNSSLTTNTDKDIWLGGNSIVDMRNSSFNKAQVTYADGSSTLHVSWFMGVNVKWPSSSGPGAPVVGATVTIKDQEGTQVAQEVTNATGAIGMKLALKEFSKSQSTEVFYSPYNISAQINPTVIGYLDADLVATEDFTVVMGDLTDPFVDITSPVGDQVFNTTSILIEGTALDPESGIKWVEVSTDGGNNWKWTTGTNESWNLLTYLADGTHTIIAKATNMAGGTTNKSVTGIVVDTNPPFIKWKTPLNNSLLNKKNLTVSGQTEPNAMINVNLVDTNATNGGDFSVDISLNEGPNTITVKAEDIAHNKWTSQRFVTVDSIKPFIDMEGPLSRAVSFFQLDLNGTTEKGASVTVNGKPVNTQPSTGKFSIMVTLDEGRNTYRFVAMDDAGNMNSTTVTVFLDTTPPSLDIIYPIEGTVLLNTSIEAKGLTDLYNVGDIAPRAYINGQETAVGFGGDFALNLTLVEGDNKITFRVVDAAGNDVEKSVRVTVDSITPTITDLNYKTGQKVNVDKILIKGVTEPRATVIVNGKTVTAGATGDFSVEVPLKIGINPITIKVEDKAGNTFERALDIEREKGGGGGGTNTTDPPNPNGGSNFTLILIIIIVIAIIIVVAAFAMKGSGGSPMPPPGDRRRTDPRAYPDKRTDERGYDDGYDDDYYDDADSRGHYEDEPGHVDGYDDDYGEAYDDGYDDNTYRDAY